MIFVLIYRYNHFPASVPFTFLLVSLSTTATSTNSVTTGLVPSHQPDSGPVHWAHSSSPYASSTSTSRPLSLLRPCQHSRRQSVRETQSMDTVHSLILFQASEAVSSSLSSSQLSTAQNSTAINDPSCVQNASLSKFSLT